MVSESVCGSDLGLEALEQAVTKHNPDGGPRDLEVPAIAAELALSGQQHV